MARYIDADKLIEEMQDCKYANPCNDYQRGVNASIDIQITGIKHIPAADVVPKSEAERLENTYNRAIRKIDNKTITAIRNAKQEVAREIFEEIESISSDFPLYGNINTVILSERDLAFIKKKYTEGEK